MGSDFRDATSNLLKRMVGLGGLEPPTSPLSGARSSHLSYRPVQHLSELVTTLSVYDALVSFAIGYKPPFWSGQNTEVATYFVPVEQKYLSRNVTKVLWCGTNPSVTLITGPPALRKR